MQEYHEIKMGSERNFGFVFSAFFALIGLWPLLGGGSAKLLLLLISVVFLVVTLVKPGLLAPLNKIWFRFGLLLGKIVAPVVMACVFFIVVLPSGLILRAMGKDILNLALKDSDSYWIKRDEQPGNMDNQY